MTAGRADPGHNTGRMALLGAATYDSNRLYYQVYQYGAWVNTSSWTRWETPFATTKKVAARWYETDAPSNNLSLLVAAVAADGRIFNVQGVPTGNGITFYSNSVWFEVSGGGRTNHGLAMTDWSADGDPIADTLRLVARGTQDGVFYQSYQGGCWNGDELCPAGGWRSFPTQGATPYGPGVYTLGTTTGYAGPVVAVTEQPANSGGLAYQITRPDVPNPPGPRSLTRLKAVPTLPGWQRVTFSNFGATGTGTHPLEQAAGWTPDWKDQDGNPIPSPVGATSAVTYNEPLNNWYPWCQVRINGERIQHWMPGENSTEAFSDLVAWLDLYYPIGGGDPQTGWNEVFGYC